MSIPLHVMKTAIYRAKVDLVTVGSELRGLILATESHITLYHTLITLTRGQPPYIIR